MLEVKDLKCGYNGIDVVKGVSFNVKEGENICIIGPNGCGKSTILKAISNLLPYKGEIKINSEEVKKLNRKKIATKVALMSQHSTIYFPYTVYETVALGRYAYSNSVFSNLSKEDKDIVLNNLEEVGIIDLKDKLINELSGGQLQRVFLARAFTQNPDVILLDEPTNHLDLKYQLELLDLVNKWSKENNKSVVGVLHDLNLVQLFGEKVVMIKEGITVSSGRTEDVLKDDIIKDVYGVDIKAFMIKLLEKWR